MFVVKIAIKKGENIIETFSEIKFVLLFSPLTCNHSFSANGSLRSKINEINIKCKHWTKGCMEIVRIRELEKHENAECYFSHYMCNRKDCEEISLPGKIKHMPECPYFLIECEVCKKSMKQSDVFYFFSSFLLIKIFFGKKINKNS